LQEARQGGSELGGVELTPQQPCGRIVSRRDTTGKPIDGFDAQMSSTHGSNKPESRRIKSVVGKLECNRHATPLQAPAWRA